MEHNTENGDQRAIYDYGNERLNYYDEEDNTYSYLYDGKGGISELVGKKATVWYPISGHWLFKKFVGAVKSTGKKIVKSTKKMYSGAKSYVKKKVSSEKTYVKKQVTKAKKAVQKVVKKAQKTVQKAVKKVKKTENIQKYHMNIGVMMMVEINIIKYYCSREEGRLWNG